MQPATAIDLAGSIRSCLEERARLLAAVSEIDQQLDAARALLSPQRDAAVELDDLPAVEVTIEERRARIVEVLRKDGPLFPSGLERVSFGVSRSTIYNDLLALCKQGVLVNTDAGYQIATAIPETEPPPQPPVVRTANPQRLEMRPAKAQDTPEPEYETVWNGGEGLSSYQQGHRR